MIEKISARHDSLSNLSLIGIDNEGAMVKEARTRLAHDPRVEILCEDAVFHDYKTSDLIVSYYSIQFIHPKFRQTLIDQIYKRLNWGGAFLLFEKVRGPDARFQDIQSMLYTKFKRDNGFTDTEILNKSESLKGILEPFSTEGNLGLLRRAGFIDIMPVFRWLCFEGILCIK